jgi:hypothetical protein
MTHQAKYLLEQGVKGHGIDLQGNRNDLASIRQRQAIGIFARGDEDSTLGLGHGQ